MVDPIAPQTLIEAYAIDGQIDDSEKGQFEKYFHNVPFGHKAKEKANQVAQALRDGVIDAKDNLSFLTENDRNFLLREVGRQPAVQRLFRVKESIATGIGEDLPANHQLVFELAQRSDMPEFAQAYSDIASITILALKLIEEIEKARPHDQEIDDRARALLKRHENGNITYQNYETQLDALPKGWIRVLRPVMEQILSKTDRQKTLRAIESIIDDKNKTPHTRSDAFRSLKALDEGRANAVFGQFVVKVAYKKISQQKKGLPCKKAILFCLVVSRS